jgi:DNA-binding NarL/FixJ family response regulator
VQNDLATRPVSFQPVTGRAENCDADVARAVLSDGASGYVLKLNANKELLRGVEVALQGGKFVSTGVRLGDKIPPLG